MTGEEKFDTCGFRSLDKHLLESRSISGCGSCGKGSTEGFFCWKHQIDDIKPEQCEVCAAWKSKVVFEK